MAIKRVCAWCKKDMGEIPGDEEGVTHGMCEECFKKYSPSFAPPNKQQKPGSQKGAKP